MANLLSLLIDECKGGVLLVYGAFYLKTAARSVWKQIGRCETEPKRYYQNNKLKAAKTLSTVELRATEEWGGNCLWVCHITEY